MKKLFLAVSTLGTLFSYQSSFADHYREVQYCENQFEKYCVCEKSWGSYGLNLVILDLKNNSEKKRFIGAANYVGDNGEKNCLEEMARMPICN